MAGTVDNGFQKPTSTQTGACSRYQRHDGYFTVASCCSFEDDTFPVDRSAHGGTYSHTDRPHQSPNEDNTGGGRKAGEVTP